MARNEPITETEANQPAPDRLQKGGLGMASAVEAQALGQPVPFWTGISTRDLPSWPRAPRRIGGPTVACDGETGDVVRREPRWSVHGLGWHRRCALGNGAVVDSGWKSVVNTSDSMAPSIRSGDRVLAAPSDGIGVGAGTVLVFDDRRGAGLVTHRIVGLNADGTYRTQDDGDGQADSTSLAADQVVAVARLLVPLVGLLVNWYSAGAWIHLLAWLTVLWLAVLVIPDAVLERYDSWVGPEVWVNASG